MGVTGDNGGRTWEHRKRIDERCAEMKLCECGT